jgi:hypothetical protein
MSIGEIKVNAHGSIEHFVSICIATKICHDRGFSIEDVQWWKRKTLYPGEPDLAISVISRKKKEGKPYNDRQNYVIEIECNPTNESIEKKNKQFKQSVEGWELIICDMRKVDLNSVSDIYKYLSMRIPIGD